ncbi:MAG: hypothetical protein QME78_00885 [Thermodesulfobacteriota bacterium]|nr:hypothetical protein [Thermodesulfobacteriota bacterium]
MRDDQLAHQWRVARAIEDSPKVLTFTNRAFQPECHAKPPKPLGEIFEALFPFIRISLNSPSVANKEIEKDFLISHLHLSPHNKGTMPLAVAEEHFLIFFDYDLISFAKLYFLSRVKLKAGDND